MKKSRLRVISEKKVWWRLLFPLALVISAGFIEGLYSYGSPGSLLFWIGIAIEIGFALLFTMARPGLSIALFVIAVGLPGILAANIDVLRPIRAVWLVFGLVGLWIMLYKLYHSGKREINSKELFEGFMLPNYVPPGFAKTEISEYRRKGYKFTELVYSDSKTEYLIWIKESKGPIHTEPRKNMQTIERIVKEVAVRIEQEILKPNSRRARSGESAFIEANWSHKGINFNFRSDGLSLDEVEKVIASMIL